MQTPSWRRRGWLALIGAAHLLGFMAWQAPERPQAAHIQAHEPITYILTPFKRPEPRVTPPTRTRAVAAQTPARQRLEPAQPVAAAPRAEPQAITLPAGAVPVVEAAPASAAPDPFAVPVKPQDDLKQRALKGALAADQQARKDAWTQRDRKYVNDETVLAAAIGKAAKGDAGAIGEFVSSDGSRVTKWRMSDGKVVCYYKASNNFSGGRDPFQDTGRVSIRECPR